MSLLLLPILFATHTVSAQNSYYAVLGPEAPAILHVLIGDSQLIIMQPGTFAAVLKQNKIRALIVSQDWAEASDIQLASIARLPIVYVERQISVAAVEGNIKLLSAFTHTQDIGTHWLRTIQEGLAQVKASVQKDKPSRVLILTPEGYTQGQGTMITDLLSYAGAINVAAAANIPDARQISDAQIRKFYPDVVLLIGWTPDAAAALALNPVYRGIPAFAQNHIYRIAPPGKDPTMLPEDAALLASLIHPIKL